MKNKYTLLAILFFSALGFSQSGINYKAIIKDDNGNIMVNQELDIRIDIMRGSGLLSYQEMHTISTDANGLIVLTIGEGTIGSGGGPFEMIPWSIDTHRLNVAIDSGSGFVSTGFRDINSVPYAIRADSAETADSANNVDGLVVKSGGNGSGWRLRDRGEDGTEGYGSIGLNAIDLSSSDANGAVVAFGYGATGNYSFASGMSTVANGDYSIAMGRNSRASGDYSFSVGLSNQISSVSPYSFAFGQSNTILGSRSVAFGNNNDVDSYQSYAFGNNNELQFSNSFVFGSNNISSDNTTYAFGFSNQNLESLTYTFGNSLTAYSTREVVFGQFNTTYTPVAQSQSWIGNTNRLFVVANGYLNIAGVPVRRNALTILKSGNIGIGTDTPQERLHINGRLRIGTETIEDSGSNRLSFNASLLPDVDNAMQLGNSSFHWTGVWATDGTINTSDRRSKTNIANLNYGLKDVLKLKPVSFNWKTNPNDDTKLGLIAQDLLQIIPEVVKTHDWETDENGNKIKKELKRMGVFYSDLVPVLIKAIQEQQETINSLKSTIQNNNSTIKNQENISLEQSKTLEALLTRVNALEQSNN